MPPRAFAARGRPYRSMRSIKMKTLIKIDRIIENIQIWFCALMFVLILVFGSLQVFGRFILHSSPPWTEEAMRFCDIYLTFIGSALTVRADAHVSVDIVISFMKNNKARAVLFIIGRLICVVFLIMFFPGSIVLVSKSFNSLGAAIRIPYAYIYAAVPLGIVMMLCSYASAIPKLARQYREGER